MSTSHITSFPVLSVPVLPTRVQLKSPDWRGWLYRWTARSRCCDSYGRRGRDPAHTPPPPTTGLPLSLNPQCPAGVSLTRVWRKPESGSHLDGPSALTGTRLPLEGTLSFIELPTWFLWSCDMLSLKTRQLTDFHPGCHFGLWPSVTPEELWQQRINNPTRQSNTFQLNRQWSRYLFRLHVRRWL